MAAKQLTTTLSTLLTSPNTTNTTMSILRRYTKRAKWNLQKKTFWDATFRSVTITSSLEAVLIIITNLLLFLIIVTSPKLRGRLRNQLVLSLVVANLLVGIFSAPFAVDTTVRRNWVHGCFVFVVLTLLTMYVQNFVTVWGTLLLLLHYAARLGRYEGPAFLFRLSSIVQRVLTGLYVAAPWLVSLVLPVPMVFGGMRKIAWAIWNDALCPIILQRWATVVLNTISFLLPIIVILVLVVVIVVLYLKRGVPEAGRGSGPSRAEMGAALVVSPDKEETESCWVYVVTAVILLLMMGPEHVFFVTRLQLKAPWKSIVISSVFVNLLSDLAPFALGLTWLLMLPDIRGRVVEVAAACRDALSCPAWCCRGRAPPSSTGSTGITPVSFKDLQDE